MKELFIVHIGDYVDPNFPHEWDDKITNIRNKIKKYSVHNQMSLYNIGGARNYNIASFLASRLELSLKDWAESDILDNLEPFSLYESFSLSMNRLNVSEKSTVIMAVSDKQLSLLISWWLKLPFDKWNQWELVIEPIGFHVLNVNKSGDRTIYKFNEG
ncbi:hypothetical protein [Paenibacillus xylanexedens]|uniref:hypothetical protein n=1 Tax=Paenibacillus xylanexedens TaxID=528191 RepID=UPI003B0244B0